MRILALNANQVQIGSYHRCFFFSRELARRGHDVTMMTVSRSSLLRPREYFAREYMSEYADRDGEGPWVRMVEGPSLGYRWGPGWGTGPLDIGGRIAAILRGRFDVVYAFEYQANVAWPVYLTRSLRSYTLLSDWCDWFAGSANAMRGIRVAHRIDAFFEERIRFAAERVSVTSRALHERALGIGVPSSRVTQIPHAVDAAHMRPYPRDEARLRFGIPPDVPMLLAICKGNADAEVRICAEVLRRNPRILCILAGKASSSSLALADELGVRSAIRFTGWVPTSDLPPLISAADICFLWKDRSTMNGHANWRGKFLDYLACGVAGAVNDIGEEGSLVRTQGVGILLSDDFVEYAEGLVEAMHDRQRLHWMGREARRVVERDWDWRVRGAQIAAFVERGV
jgi:glycosyltransferase involved in cell wall biosynthesis